jgi:hypothetical protein
VLDGAELYEHDILLWSEQQAELLRRLARGERVNGVNWDHVVEEIDDVGNSELHAVTSLLRQAVVHLLKVAARPDSQASSHWRADALGFLPDAADRFAPSMRQRINLEKVYKRAHQQVSALIVDDRGPADLPHANPFSLDALLAGDPAKLEAQLHTDRHVV